MSVRDRRSNFSISIRYQDNSHLFKVKRALQKAEELLCTTMSLEQLNDEVDEIENQFRKILADPNESLCIKVVNEVREFLAYISQESRELAIEAMLNRGVCDCIVKILEFVIRDSLMDLLRQMTWLIQVLLTTSSSISSQIVDLGILSIYTKLLNIDDPDILGNVIWGFANMVSDNRTVRDTMEDTGLLDKVSSRVKEVYSDSLDFSLMCSYILFVSHYFALKPSFSFERMKSHFFEVVKFFTKAPVEEMQFILIELLEFLLITTNLAEEEDVEDFVKKPIWPDFITRLIEMLTDTDYEVTWRVTESLTNLTFFSLPDLGTENNEKIIENLNRNIRKKQGFLESLELLSNLVQSGDHFVKRIILSGIVPEVFFLSLSIGYENKQFCSALNALSVILNSAASIELAEHLENHIEFLDQFVLKLNIKLAQSSLLKMGEVLKIVFQLGEILADQSEDLENPFTKYLMKRDQLLQALEECISTNDDEVANMFTGIIHTYFNCE